MNALRSRSFGTTVATLAGGKTKIKSRKSRGRAKEHRMGGPTMQETFDLKNLDTYLGNDVPSWIHWRWDEARMRLKGLRLIAYQMPGLQRAPLLSSSATPG